MPTPAFTSLPLPLLTGGATRLKWVLQGYNLSIEVDEAKWKEIIYTPMDALLLPIIIIKTVDAVRDDDDDHISSTTRAAQRATAITTTPSS